MLNHARKRVLTRKKGPSNIQKKEIKLNHWNKFTGKKNTNRKKTIYEKRNKETIEDEKKRRNRERTDDGHEQLPHVINSLNVLYY